MTRIIPSALTLFLGALLPACGSAAQTPEGPVAAEGAPAAPQASATTAEADRGPVVARVNGTPIYQTDLDGAVENYLRSNGVAAASDDQKTQARQVVLDGLIGSELLYQKARESRTEVAPAEVTQAIEQTRNGMGQAAYEEELARRRMDGDDIEQLVRQNITVQKFIRETIVDQVNVGEAEVRQFYEEHKAQMQLPPRVQASHILVKTSPEDPPEKKAEARKRIDAALGRVKAGEDFAAVAREVSEDNSAPQGGALGAIQRGQTVPPFEEAAFRLGVGDVSDVVESQFGYHVIKVTGKVDASTATLDEARDQIQQFLKQRKAQEAIERMVQELRAAAKVEIL
ncbi:MAG TPA: peptidylprolyl isomerase [Candidatus Polarisedimenticolia bacterium]|nr:peptidylprolyl isomerase [Candidatus Polarisedimenticolia bacterium]